MLRVQIARDAAEIGKWSSLWDAAFAPEHTIFQTHRWNLLSASAFASREEPYFVLAESDSGVAILPAVIDRSSGVLSFAGERLFDYRDCLCTGDEALLRRAWVELAALHLPLRISGIRRPLSEPWNSLPEAPFSRAPRLMRSSTSAEQFARSHSRAFSRLRKLERLGLSVNQHPGDSRLVRYIYQQRAAQAPADDLFQDPMRVEFMVEICREEGSGCEIFTLEHGGTVTAAIVTFRDGEYRRFYTAYYAREWARYSPGVSLLFEIARRSLEQGLNLDFMTGEQGYKMRIAQSGEELFTVDASAGDIALYGEGKSVESAA